ncbi:Acetohydroxy-acid reductoisomerase [Rhodotorula toruloides]|nr:Acetohydroxy-acid reductoisomerase [Rhodotorula toruloides]
MVPERGQLAPCRQTSGCLLRCSACSRFADPQHHSSSGEALIIEDIPARYGNGSQEKGAANKPVFEKLYKSVRDGTETRRSLEFNGRKDYREAFAKETAEIDNQEIWRAGKTVRSLRPDAKNN